MNWLRGKWDYWFMILSRCTNSGWLITSVAELKRQNSVKRLIVRCRSCQMTNVTG